MWGQILGNLIPSGIPQGSDCVGSQTPQYHILQVSDTVNSLKAPQNFPKKHGDITDVLKFKIVLLTKFAPTVLAKT
jgi:hypothetical protein